MLFLSINLDPHYKGLSTLDNCSCELLIGVPVALILEALLSFHSFLCNWTISCFLRSPTASTPLGAYSTKLWRGLTLHLFDSLWTFHIVTPLESSCMVSYSSSNFRNVLSSYSSLFFCYFWGRKRLN